MMPRPVEPEYERRNPSICRTNLYHDSLDGEEQKAVERLYRALYNWPSSLTLFGASGWLSIRKPGAGSQFAVADITGIPVGGDGSDEFE